MAFGHVTEVPNRKVRCKIDHYILHTFILVIILLLIITINCYNYRIIAMINCYNTESKIINFKNFVLKIVCVIISISILRLEDFGIDDILIDKKAHYDVSYKTLIGGKPLHIRFSKIDKFFGSFDGTRYLGLFDSEKYDTVYNKIRYLVILKSSITYVFSLYYAKAKVDSYDSLTIEKKWLCIML